ncbi:hypothetical protein CONPUDRAFT_75717 [Coniophora puteana RWD-64-598 SS2]|uniref:Uncharacterized protein n=1 Tax=Coniophora puteana (strain RWD-64-598) TaxID=741705 RepID=A0A5M3MFC9_CONPW|nr:uncharacterized protein CONPUDRAFT_75717 [Coniophora puteana RWD-64-598 SS2]EIW77969.1 hypothetical protein CONPUDRAFT_75717 [Coniophora puteana RWD-64-598 SS2]
MADAEVAFVWSLQTISYAQVALLALASYDYTLTSPSLIQLVVLCLSREVRFSTLHTFDVPDPAARLNIYGYTPFSRKRKRLVFSATLVYSALIDATVTDLSIHVSPTGSFPLLLSYHRSYALWALIEITCIIPVSALQYSMITRLYALYDGSKRLLTFMVACFVAEQVVNVTILAINFRNIHNTNQRLSWELLCKDDIWVILVRDNIMFYLVFREDERSNAAI